MGLAWAYAITKGYIIIYHLAETVFIVIIIVVDSNLPCESMVSGVRSTNVSISNSQHATRCRLMLLLLLLLLLLFKVLLLLLLLA